MPPFFHGSLLALTLCFNIGPGLVLQFNASINRGFFAGAGVVAGLYLTNVFILTISYFGIGRFLQIDEHLTIAGIAGGVVLIAFGTVMLVRRVSSPHAAVRPGAHVKRGIGSYLFYVLKGATVNVSNPFNILFWLGMTGLAGSQFGAGSGAFQQFFLGLFTTAILIDLLKCYTFSKAGHFLRTRTLNIINHTMGILLVVLGIVLIVRSFF